MSTLYVIGVGPGDPELLTLKAVRLIRAVPVLFVPKGREDGSSLALSIAGKVIDVNDKEVRELHFPMIKTRDTDSDLVFEKWDSISEEVTGVLKLKDAAFLTLGDPCIYSTFFYLYDRLLKQLTGLKIEIVPAVSSINASAARAGISLGLADERIAILPATYTDNIQETLKGFDTVVLMKVNRVFNELLKALEELNMIENAVYISRAGMEDEKIFKDIREVKKDDLDYFSMVIVKK